MVAGRTLLTVAFRSGSHNSAPDHTIVFWPRSHFTEKQENQTDKGLIVHASSPAQGAAPEAQTALDHAAIAPSIDSLFIDAEWAPG